MFKLFNKFYLDLKTVLKSQAFKKKPLRTILNLLIVFFSLLIRIKINYKIKIKNKNFLYTFKPYMASGMGGRGQFIFREYYDPFLLNEINNLSKNFNFIDVGCSRGFFTLFLLAANNNAGKAICVDPFDYALSDLKEVISLNSFSNVHILKGVVSDKISERMLLQNITKPSESSIISKKEFQSNSGLYCKSFTIDQIVFSMNLIDRVDFIKLDAESAEYEILLGSLKTLKKYSPTIYLEVTRKRKEIEKLLLDYKYSLYYFSQEKFIPLNENESPGSILAKPNL